MKEQKTSSCLQFLRFDFYRVVELILHAEGNEETPSEKKSRKDTFACDVSERDPHTIKIISLVAKYDGDLLHVARRR